MVMVNIPLSTLIEELEVVRSRLREGFWKPTFAIVSIKGISFLSNKLTPSWEVNPLGEGDSFYLERHSGCLEEKWRKQELETGQLNLLGEIE